MNDRRVPYKLTFEPRPGYLYARVEADDIDRDTALLYLREVAEKAAELKSKKIILERNIPTMLPDADLFFTTKDFLEMIGNAQVAFVNPHAAIGEAMEFAITIGTNRGARYRLFNTVEDAEKWLLPE